MRMMSQELSRSSDSSRTNSREILEVVLHKKGAEEEDPHPHHHHPLHHHHLHHPQHPHQHQQTSSQPNSAPHPLQQLHQHRSVDSSGRLSAMLVRGTHMHHNHLGGEVSGGAPSSFSRKSLSRQSLDSNNSRLSDPGHAPEPAHHACAATFGRCNGNAAAATAVGAFLNSVALLAVASLILATMSLLLLASLAQEHADARDSRTVREHSAGAGAPRDKGASAPGQVSSDKKGKGGGEGLDGAVGRKVGGVSLTGDTGKRSVREERMSSAFTGEGGAAERPSSDEPVRDEGQGRRVKDVEEMTLTATPGSASVPILLEAAVAMATLVAVADLCCLMVCCMQCFFAAKLLTMHQGEERSAKYLRECSSSRFIAVMGFFLSIPAFLVAVVLLVVVKLHPGPALTSGVVVGVGGLFCVLSVMQNLYHWRVEKARADDRLPVYQTSSTMLRDRPSKLPLTPPVCHHHLHSPPLPHPHPLPPNPHPANPNPPVTVQEQEGSTATQKNELATLV